MPLETSLDDRDWHNWSRNNEAEARTKSFRECWKKWKDIHAAECTKMTAYC
jgi:hypothetical protein